MGDIRKVMSEMRDVVEAMLDRLQVDLGTDVISTSLCSFDIASWRSAQEHPSLTKRVESLTTSLRLSRSVGREFAVVANTLVPILEAAKRHHISIPNRVAWSWVLVSEWRSVNLPSRYKILPGDLQHLICFYLSIKLNTTTLECDVGQLCRQIGGRQGPTAEDGSLASALVEVALMAQNVNRRCLKTTPVMKSFQAACCPHLWQERRQAVPHMLRKKISIQVPPEQQRARREETSHQGFPEGCSPGQRGCSFTAS